MSGRVSAALAVLLLAAVLTFPCTAYEVGGTSDSPGVGEVSDYLPDEVKEALPDEIASAAEDGTLAGALSFGSFAEWLGGTLSSLISPALASLSTLLGVVILTAVLSALRQNIAGEGLAAAFEYCGTLVISLVAYGYLSALWDKAAGLLESLDLLMNSMLGSMGVLYAAGGNAATAAVSNAGLTTAFALLENLCTNGLYPVLRLCFGLTLVSGVSGTLNLSGLSGIVRGTFTTVIAFVTAALTAILAFQTKLAASADCLTVRAVRFTAGSLIPVVGGSVSEAVRTLGGSLSYIRTTVGGLCVAAIVMLVLPTAVEIMLCRASLSLCSSLAAALGCEREGKLLGELHGLVGYLLAVLSICAVFFILAVTLFIKTEAAIA